MAAHRLHQGPRPPAAPKPIELPRETCHDGEQVVHKFFMYGLTVLLPVEDVDGHAIASEELLPRRAWDVLAELGPLAAALPPQARMRLDAEMVTGRSHSGGCKPILSSPSKQESARSTANFHLQRSTMRGGNCSGLGTTISLPRIAIAGIR
jgi:hypothetical protein